MAGKKTSKTDASVEDFLHSVEHDGRRGDAFELLDLMKKATGEEPAMWGPSIVGFGDAHYVYESGREGDWFKVGFSPRKSSMTIYLMAPSENRSGYLSRLGKFKTGVGCVYINKLDDVDLEVLEALVADASEAVD